MEVCAEQSSQIKNLKLKKYCRVDSYEECTMLYFELIHVLQSASHISPPIFFLGSWLYTGKRHIDRVDHGDLKSMGSIIIPH